MARELISSKLSYQMLKFGMPASFLGFGVLLIALVLANAFGAPVILKDDSPGIRILVVVIAPLATVALIAWAWDLKYVELDGNKLLVSGVRRRIVVPLTEVAAIRQNVMEPGHPIYVALKTPGAFGETFSFVPSPLYSWESPSLVERLRALAGIHEEASSDGAAA